MENMQASGPARQKGIERKKGHLKTEKLRRKGKGMFVCWLVALRPSNRLVYLRDGSAQTI